MGYKIQNVPTTHRKELSSLFIMCACKHHKEFWAKLILLNINFFEKLIIDSFGRGVV
ncbi:MAG: hypothetical protein Harvfovirus2_48 [Harvfovirus sp.]|uniref:Uncharacterized protein n=1 Tax=Harvfovirus sp. TaxID=2487768 RepID=A0A3G5A016_9VIRU|nr:MAG: hypothetical protein Harvfovirus2_48 [Harvfovirus sp.]